MAIDIQYMDLNERKAHEAETGRPLVYGMRSLAKEFGISVKAIHAKAHRVGIKAYKDTYGMRPGFWFDIEEVRAALRNSQTGQSN